MTHVLISKGARPSSSSTWMYRTLRHIRHKLHRSRCSTAVISTLLTLYSILLCLVSLPLLTTPLAATPTPTPIHPHSPDEPYPHPLHHPIAALSPCYGVYELKGRRHYMEDTHAVLGYGQLTTSRMAASSEFAEEVEYGGWSGAQRVVQSEQKRVEGGRADGMDGSRDGSGWLLFGVFDGHGGPDASTYTATHLLPLLHSHLTAYEHQTATSLPLPSDSAAVKVADCVDGSDFTTADTTPSAASLCTATSIPAFDTLSSVPSLLPPHHSLTAAFSSSYRIVDEGYRLHPLSHHRRHQHSDGSTALVAAINVLRGQVVVANAGDCRAIVIAEESGEGKELVERDKWKQAMSWLCRRGDGDESDEECVSSGSDNDGVAGGGVDEEEDEEDVLDEKTAAVTEAELMDMYHHFHPALPASPTLHPPPPPPSSLFLPLSVDHKPHLPLERLYIQSQPSGFITQSRHYGISRVQGVLATSRAIGDYELRPHVRCEPDVVGWQMSEVSGVSGQPTQQGRWLLLGSDGLFDVWSNVAVAQWVRQQAGRGLSVQRMAKELVMAAYRMGSEDNISALIVDLHCLQASLQATQAQASKEQK